MPENALKFVYCLIFLIAVNSLFFSLARATDLSSSSFIIRDSITGGSGGGYSSASSFQLWSSFSQFAPGASDATDQLRAGFLYFPVPAAAASSPASSETPSTGSGTGNGSYASQPNMPISLPEILNPLIAFITGEPVPSDCNGISRSDLNCDGEVNLRDLSVLFSRPKVITARVLSLLFSDWTQRLPVLTSIELPSVAPIQPQINNQPAPSLAQLESLLATGTQTAIIKPVISIWQKFIKIVDFIFNFIISALFKIFNILKVLITRL